MKQYAVFGEGTYAFTDNLKLTAGVRYYKFDSRADEETSGFATDSGNAAATYNSFTQDNSGANPKVTLSYEQNHDLTVYGTVARGFRPGGINQQIPSSICTISPETYGPDTTWNYEVGEKARMLDSRLVLNADVYYIRWTQVQQVVNQECGYPLTVNAGDAASYGPEIELTALLTPELTLTFSGTYTHSTLTSVNPSVTAVDPSLASGLPILNIPKYTETTSLTYTTPISDAIKFIGASQQLVRGSIDGHRIHLRDAAGVQPRRTALGPRGPPAVGIFVRRQRDQQACRARNQHHGLLLDDSLAGTRGDESAAHDRRRCEI